MKKADYITKINDLITDHDLDIELVPEDTEDSVKDLKATLAEVNEAVEAATAPPVVKVADLARELEKDPKTVRARLRRLYDKDESGDLPQPVEGGQRWTFAEEDREAVVALISDED